MIAFMLARAVQSLGVVLAVALIAFSLFSFAGDPVAGMAGQDATPAERAVMRHELGLDRNVAVRFGRFVAHAVRGDFGLSYAQGRPVGQMLAEAAPATLELAAVSTALALLLGVPMGLYAGIHPQGVLSRSFLVLSLTGVSVPVFLIGILLIYLFSVRLGWLPAFGRGEVVRVGLWTTGLLTRGGLRALVLPATTLCLFQLALIVRLVRAEMRDVLSREFIRYAHARGLSPVAIHYGHALRNALLPLVTIGSLQFGTVIAFSVVTESVFEWPGLGRLLIQAVQSADIPVMAAYLVLVALIFGLLNFLADVLAFVIDPRLRQGGASLS